MTDKNEWISTILPKHRRLTRIVRSIIENILTESDVEYLSVSGRTKERKSIVEKVSRKGYSDPTVQMTDVTGVRIVVFSETDVRRVQDILEKAFVVDKANSSNKDLAMQPNQIGYRSVHYVCDLGAVRGGMDEYKGLDSLKFEIQVRTVLQHAWAELAHDRNYKFKAKLPEALERQLFLYAGLLEIADKGFDAISREIDSYNENVASHALLEDWDMEVSSTSVEAYVNSWCEKNSIELALHNGGGDISDLVTEVRDFGISTVSQLAEIEPPGYALAMKEANESCTIYGLIRDWMLIKDWRKFFSRVKFSWALVEPDDDINATLKIVMGDAEYSSMVAAYFEMQEPMEDF